MNKNNITAAILCGGKSTRIGKYKPFLKVNDKTIIENTIDVLKKFFETIIISANEIEPFKNFNLKIIKDIIPNKDIFGGIYSILKNISTDYVFIVPCDMPFINSELINFTLSLNYSEYDVVFYSLQGKFQPLFAIYSKKCIDFFEKAVKQKHFPRLMDITKEYKSLILTENHIPNSIDIKKAFFNINTEEDYYKAKNNFFKETPIIGIVAMESKSGKTTLIENLIKKFKQENFKIGVLKHSVHKIEIDHKGKDTYRFFENGADAVIIDTNDQIAIRKRLKNSLPVKYIKDKYLNDMDLVIVEGHKGGNFPKIEIIKENQKNFLFKNDSNIIGIVSNKKISNLLPHFNPNEIEKIYNFIKNTLAL